LTPFEIWLISEAVSVTKNCLVSFQYLAFFMQLAHLYAVGKTGVLAF